MRYMLADGYDVTGIDVSPKQVALARGTGLTQVEEGDYLRLLRDRPGRLAAVTTVDLLDHLTNSEVLATFDAVAAALRPGGRFVARVPNALSPFGGHVRYGDFTHETWYAARSVRQLAVAAGFGPCRGDRLPAVSVRGGEHGQGNALEAGQRSPGAASAADR
jgi:SAM-dependent methyltransferase